MGTDAFPQAGFDSGMKESLSPESSRVQHRKTSARLPFRSAACSAEWLQSHLAKGHRCAPYPLQSLVADRRRACLHCADVSIEGWIEPLISLMNPLRKLQGGNLALGVTCAPRMSLDSRPFRGQCPVSPRECGMRGQERVRCSPTSPVTTRRTDSRSEVSARCTWPNSLLSVEIAIKRRHDRLSHCSDLSRYGSLSEGSSLLEAWKQFPFEELIEQYLVSAQGAYRMDGGGDVQLMFELRFNIRDRAVEIAICKQVRFAQQNQCRNSGLIEKTQRPNILFVERGAGVDQEKSEVAGRKVSQCLCRTAFGQRTKSRSVHEQDAMLAVSEMESPPAARTMFLKVSRISLFGDEPEPIPRPRPVRCGHLHRQPQL